MDWFDEGYWAINNQRDTAAQFLALEAQPVDNTPGLNDPAYDNHVGTCYGIFDPGNETVHKACTLDFFKNNRFDYVVASIPAHIPLFKGLIAKYQPHAKLIVQIGNEWPMELLRGNNVLASVKPRTVDGVNAIFYHQEFDQAFFYPSAPPLNKNIYSFVNILQNMPLAWSDFESLERILGRKGFDFRSFGGQCRDGNMTGPHELAQKMREAMLIFHVKEGGDGFGHIIHNAYAVGRPIVTRSRFYKDRLAEELLVPGTFIDLDTMSIADAANKINRLSYMPDTLAEMGQKAAARFREVVNYEQEAEQIKVWLANLVY